MKTELICSFGPFKFYRYTMRDAIVYALWIRDRILSVRSEKRPADPPTLKIVEPRRLPKVGA